MPLSLPSGFISEWNAQPALEATESASAFGTNRQRIFRGGQHWAIELRLQPMLPADARKWLTLDTQLDTVLWPIPQSDFVAANEGAPRVMGAGQLGSTLNVDGLTPGYEAPVGAFISIITNNRRYLYRIEEDATANASGLAALKVSPMLRISPNDNDVVEIAAPKIEGYARWTGLRFQVREGRTTPPTTVTIVERG